MEYARVSRGERVERVSSVWWSGEVLRTKSRLAGDGRNFGRLRTPEQESRLQAGEGPH